MVENSVRDGQKIEAWWPVAGFWSPWFPEYPLYVSYNYHMLFGQHNCKVCYDRLCVPGSVGLCYLEEIACGDRLAKTKTKLGKPDHDAEGMTRC